MKNTKYDKFWYFRTRADEDDDTDQAASIMMPVSNIVSMIPTSTTEMRIYFNQATSGTPVAESNVTGQYGSVTLTITQGKVRDTIADLISLINAGPRFSDGIKVIADDSTVEVGGAAGSKEAVYFSHITACGAINAR